MTRSVLLRFSENLFRRWWLYLLPILILFLGGVIYFFVSKNTYVAQGILYVQQQTYLAQLNNLQNSSIGGSFVSPSKTASDEINEMLKTDSFIRAIIKQTPLEAKMNATPAQVDQLITTVRSSITTSSSGNNQLAITASYEDPTIATALASSLLDNYLRWKSNSQRADSQAAVDFLTKIVGQYQVEVQTASANLQDYLGAHPQPLRGERPPSEQVQLASLQKEVDVAVQRMNDTITKSESARLSLAQIDTNAKGSFIVIDSPHVPQSSMASRTSKALTSAIFPLIGLIISIVAWVINSLSDHSYNTAAEVSRSLQLPVVAVFPDNRRELLRELKKRQKAKGRRFGIFTRSGDSKPVSAGE